MKGFTGALVAALVGQAIAAPPEPPTRVLIEERAARATVSLGPSSTVIGSAVLGVEAFKGIPYAVPPVGSLRLKPPVRRTAALGTFDATGIEAACPQFLISTKGTDLLTDVLAQVGGLLNTPFFQTVTTQSEDCLTINVVRPAGTKAGDKLPVLFWIFGGGFEVSL
jgi:carboxylesterase type B